MAEFFSPGDIVRFRTTKSMRNEFGRDLVHGVAYSFTQPMEELIDGTEYEVERVYKDHCNDREVQEVKFTKAGKAAGYHISNEMLESVYQAPDEVLGDEGSFAESEFTGVFLSQEP